MDLIEVTSIAESLQTVEVLVVEDVIHVAQVGFDLLQGVVQAKVPPEELQYLGPDRQVGAARSRRRKEVRDRGADGAQMCELRMASITLAT